MRSSPAWEDSQEASHNGKPSRSGTLTSSPSSWLNNRPSSSLSWADSHSPNSVLRTRSQASRLLRQLPLRYQQTTRSRSLTPSLLVPSSLAKLQSSSPQARRVSWMAMTMRVPSTSWPLDRKRKRRRPHRSLPPKRKLRKRRLRRRRTLNSPSRASLLHFLLWTSSREIRVTQLANSASPRRNSPNSSSCTTRWRLGPI